MKLLRPDFEYIRAFARDKTSIIIGSDRDHFIESRVGPVADSEGFGSIQELCQALRASRDLTNLHLKVIDAITTNETLFFRDIHPFDALRTDIIPELMAAAPNRKLHFWSAACSTGQEPYSIALTIREHFPSLWPGLVSIDATDLVGRVLDQARRGCYSSLEVKRGMPEPLLARYFRHEGNHWKLRDEIRQMVRFSQMNLSDSWPSMPGYDVIFMRNVLIYFEVEAKRRILSHVARQMQPNGYFIMGSAETPIGLCPQFQAHRVGQAVVYRLTGEAA